VLAGSEIEQFGTPDFSWNRYLRPVLASVVATYPQAKVIIYEVPMVGRLKRAGRRRKSWSACGVVLSAWSSGTVSVAVKRDGCGLREILMMPVGTLGRYLAFPLGGKSFPPPE